jgi:hypothetical protein
VKEMKSNKKNSQSFKKAELDFGGYILAIAIGVVMAFIIFLIGLMIGVSSNCPAAEKIIEKDTVLINSTDLNACLDYVKNSDLFQKSLYKKEWMG